MTIDEIKKKISEAPEQEWFKTISVSFNQQLSFTGLSAIYEFVNEQTGGWEDFKNLPNELERSKTYFANIKKAIIDFVDHYSKQNKVNLSSYWKGQVSNYINNTTANFKPLLYNIPETEFLIHIYKNAPNYFQGAYNFLLKTNQYSINNPDVLYGAILAYEFTLNDKSGITNRREIEESAISKLRNDFQSWFESTKKEQWQTWFDPTKKRIAELEETYKEKLKLEEPAKYWDNRAKKLKKQSWWSLGIFVGIVVVICIFLGFILWNPPEIFKVSILSGDKSTAIKWILVYATLLSFLAYCIRALSKMMFSSFHLARDCEERHTLTYFYLSLLKDSNVTDIERQLIMQSLFSRADTGLLKDDSSPTMPSDVISKVISK